MLCLRQLRQNNSARVIYSCTVPGYCTIHSAGAAGRCHNVQMLPLVGEVFVLDPGHGGYDPGVMQDNVLEKQIVLEIALKLRHYLQSAGARVVMTRETDRDF